MDTAARERERDREREREREREQERGGERQRGGEREREREREVTYIGYNHVTTSFSYTEARVPNINNFKKQGV